MAALRRFELRARRLSASANNTQIACAAGGRGDPCTQCESEKRKVARGALLCSQGREREIWIDEIYYLEGSRHGSQTWNFFELVGKVRSQGSYRAGENRGRRGNPFHL